MAEGAKTVSKSPEETLDRIRMAMSGGNFEITKQADDTIHFKHGTYLTQSASLMPKHGYVLVEPAADGTRVSYHVEPDLPVRIWLGFFGVVFFWLVFPPLIAYHALVNQPRKLMENLLQAI